MLSNLHKLIVKIHQMNRLVVLGIDANETLRHGGPIQHEGISKFCSDTGLVDTIFEKNYQCPIPFCDWSSDTPIDFIFCSAALLPYIQVGMLPATQGVHLTIERLESMLIQAYKHLVGIYSRTTDPERKGVLTNIKRRHQNLCLVCTEDRQNTECLTELRHHPKRRKMVDQ